MVKVELNYEVELFLQNIKFRVFLNDEQQFIDKFCIRHSHVLVK